MTTSITLNHQGSSSLSGQSQKFTQDKIRFGRRPDNDVAFDVNRDRAVSGYHAELYEERGAVYLKDLGSANGTFVDGGKVTRPTRLASGQVVRLGGDGPEMEVKFEAKRARPALSAPTPAPVKEGVGIQTLNMAIQSATRSERSRVYKLVGISFAILLLLGVGITIAVAAGMGKLWFKVDQVEQENEERMAALESTVKKRLKSYDRELEGVKGQIDSNQEEVFRLAQEIEEREKEHRTYLTKDDLDASQKKAKAENEKRLAEIHKRFEEQLNKASQGAPSWDHYASRYEKSIFLVFGTNREGQLAIGTAWCVGKTGILATNGHVIQIFNDFAPPKGVIGVAQNKTGEMFKVLEWKKHPRYNNWRSPDVGIAKIELKPGAELVALPLATPAELKALRIGTPLGTMGYPGEMLQEYLIGLKRAGDKVFAPKAQATFKVGFVSRIMNYEMEAADWTQTHFIQHSTSTTGGTSGSPMFNADGKVVMLNNSSLKEYVYKMRHHPGAKARFENIPSAAMIRYGIRVDELQDLLRASGWN